MRTLTRIGDAVMATLYYGAWVGCFAVLGGIGYLAYNVDKLPVIQPTQTQLVCQRQGEPERLVMQGTWVYLEGGGWYVGGQRFQPAYDESCWTRQEAP